ncbi:hypothetical protein HAX54_037456, partial [Datura stramonium]|nr:hypothetical protein [Datura stramonium]
STQTLQDVPLSAPQASQDSCTVFMPNLGFDASSSQRSSHKSIQQKSKPARPSRSMTNVKQHVVRSNAVVDEVEEVEGEHEDENEQSILRPKVISKVRTRLQHKKMQQQPTGTRRIDLKGDETGVSMSTNLPFSPRKLSWKEKVAMTSNQLTLEKDKKIGKLKTRRGKY